MASIEAHVRAGHLNREPDEQYDDGEEEFYYTGQRKAQSASPSSLSLFNVAFFLFSRSRHPPGAAPARPILFPLGRL